jgi:hypothetical protein
MAIRSGYRNTGTPCCIALGTRVLSERVSESCVFRKYIRRNWHAGQYAYLLVHVKGYFTPRSKVIVVARYSVNLHSTAHGNDSNLVLAVSRLFKLHLNILVEKNR